MINEPGPWGFVCILRLGLVEVYTACSEKPITFLSSFFCVKLIK